MSNVVDISCRRDEVSADKIKMAWEAFDKTIMDSGVSTTGIPNEILCEAVFRLWDNEDRAALKARVLKEAGDCVDGLFDSIGD